VELTQTDGRWWCRIAAPGWPELSAVVVRFDTSGHTKPALALLAAVELLAQKATDVREQVEQGLSANERAYWIEQFGLDDVSVDALGTGNVYWGRLRGVMVWQPEGDTGRIGFDFESTLDENEHGVGVVWASGRVLSVGSSEQALP
jgi:hypothetical protein